MAQRNHAGSNYAGYLIACTEVLGPYKGRIAIGAPDVDVRVEACHLWLASNGANVWNRRTLGLHDIVEPESMDEVRRMLEEEAKARRAYLLQFTMPRGGKASASDLVQRVAAYIPRQLAETGEPYHLLAPNAINMKRALWARKHCWVFTKRTRSYIKSPSRDGK